jgi:NAD-dependent deacetylase
MLSLARGRGRTELGDKVVVFTGAGASQESGLRTFRDLGGLWHEHRIEDIASPEGFRKNPAMVLNFYNTRRKALLEAQPNAAHRAIADLEKKFEVVVVTQNVDDLHERAGSTHVIHVHGEILKNQSSADPSLVYFAEKPEIEIGDLCERGSQLRPAVVWFGEAVLRMDESARHFREASKVLVVGTSLTVFPAAGLVDEARRASERYLVSPDDQPAPWGFRHLRGKAGEMVPRITTAWLAGRTPV